MERTRFVKQVELALTLSQPIGVSELDQVVGTAALARVEGTTDVVSSTLETRDFTICCNEPHPAAAGQAAAAASSAPIASRPSRATW